jgi:hypothetical protein
MRGRFVRMVIILALGIPLSSGASCAWVLWEKVATHGQTVSKEDATPHWELHTAMETKDDCETMLTKVWQLKMHETTPNPDTPGLEGRHATPGFVSETHPGKDGQPLWTTYTYHCLPATLDPRGPKSSS